ncbi:MAG: hypothetical protein ACJAU6_000501 [Alphaproteobacteria bacterium]|jgi:hypothetical protein
MLNYMRYSSYPQAKLVIRFQNHLQRIGAGAGPVFPARRLGNIRV